MITFALPRNHQPNNDTGEISKPSSEPVPSPNPPMLDLAEIAAESQKRPDQDHIDRIDGVSSSVSQHHYIRLTQIPDAGSHCL